MNDLDMSSLSEAAHANQASVIVPVADHVRLQVWLTRNLPGAEGPVHLQPIGQGQSNPTFIVSFPAAPGLRCVLRKQPPGELLPSAHAIDREYRVLQALFDTGVPVPKVQAWCDDRSVLGTPFYVMEWLDGRVLSSHTLPELPIGERRAYWFAMAETLARLHAVDPVSVGLSDYGRPGNFFARQIARWTRQWQDSRTREDPCIEHLIRWLPAHTPPGEAQSIVHGDFRLGNLMFHPTEPRVIGILDWELSTLGHPLADAAFSAMAWHTRPEAFDGLLGLDCAELGLPAQAEYLDHYRQARLALTGNDEPVTAFHLAFSLFRFAVILEGVAARARAGNAASADAHAVGAQSAAFARAAAELAC